VGYFPDTVDKNESTILLELWCSCLSTLAPRTHKKEEALERFIWFHEHALEHDQSMYGVRLSFALSYWKSLGESYPPAQKALVKTRDDKAKLIREGRGSKNLFHDVMALNRKRLIRSIYKTAS